MLFTDDQLKTILLHAGIIKEESFPPLLEFAKSSEMSLAEAVVDKDIISDEHLGILIADALKFPFAVLSKISIPDDVLHIVPEKFARKHKVIAFSRDATAVKLAMADPGDLTVQQMIAAKANLKVIPHFATERDIFNTLHVYRKNMQNTFDVMVRQEISKVDKTRISDAPVAKIVDLLVGYAYQDKASDIHIEPQEKNSLVRFRIDGVLHDVLFLPKSLHDQIITRIKILSKLRTDEHLSPQDGKMRIILEEEELDIRVSILPIVEGEKIVMRLLASRFRQFSLINLGMSEKDLKKVAHAYGRSYGMILSTGPTGSGKTTSIYSILKILNTREKNITTIEDPVEYRIKGVNQIQVNAKTNLTFASGLRSILRQDPNIVFVGEIRDNETAGIAVNAALTGHLVLSTLHTNDAATALPRLIDMDVEPFLVASTVNVIIAQRLIRKICEMCKASYPTTIDTLKLHLPEEAVKRHFGDKKELLLYKGNGCKICHSTGYSGRLGVFEVLEVTKVMKDLITKRSDAEVLVRKAVEEGMTTMLDDGIDKIIKGLTTIEEVLRVTKVDSV